VWLGSELGIAQQPPTSVTPTLGVALFLYPEEVAMDEMARQIGETIRDALESWSRIARLCVLLAVAAAAVTCFYLFTH
jgi:hypothetical protein